MKNINTHKIAWIIAILLIYIAVSFLFKSKFLNMYHMQILILLCINIILAVSLNLIIGFTGQLTLGHAGFMSAGGYAAAIVSIHLNLPFLIALLFAGLVAGFMGYLVGKPILRLRGDYLAITTLGFGEIIRVLIVNLDFLGGFLLSERIPIP